MSAYCKPWVQLFVGMGSGWPHSALQYITHADQLQSASGLESISCKKCYSKCWTLAFCLFRSID